MKTFPKQVFGVAAEIGIPVTSPWLASSHTPPSPPPRAPRSPRRELTRGGDPDRASGEPDQTFSPSSPPLLLPPPLPLSHSSPPSLSLFLGGIRSWIRFLFSFLPLPPSFPPSSPPSPPYFIFFLFVCVCAAVCVCVCFCMKRGGSEEESCAETLRRRRRAARRRRRRQHAAEKAAGTPALGR